MAGIMIIANTRKRSQAISIEGRLVERYFAVTSEVPRKIVESRISAMPLKGRSARAGPRRSSAFASGNGSGAASTVAEIAGFFSGNGNEARPILATAAGGGVTANLEQNSSNQASLHMTRIAPRRQHPIVGCRYALRARKRGTLIHSVRKRVSGRSGFTTSAGCAVSPRAETLHPALLSLLHRAREFPRRHFPRRVPRLPLSESGTPEFHGRGN